MKLFVVGKLGEIVKKICDLEYILKDNPTNTLLIAELAAYQQVLNIWPVLEKNELDQSVDVLKFRLAYLREKEADLREENSVLLYDVMAKNRYLLALDAARDMVAHINSLGMYIGELPLLEVEDAEHPRDIETVSY